VKDKKMKRILRFTASWCGPCKSLAQNLEVANLQIPIEVVDIDVQTETATDFGIRGVPTLVLMEGNTEIKRLVGAKTVNELQEWVA
jgi:thioredoxin-like negative regulator of GroEL